MAKGKPRSKRGTDVAEVFSPPRMTKMAQKLDMEAGLAVDLTTCDAKGVAWDLSKPAIQQKTLELVEKVKLTMLGMIPPCAMFSTMQNANIGKMKEDVMVRAKESMAHFTFCVLLCIKQSETNRYFMVEHPV